MSQFNWLDRWKVPRSFTLEITMRRVDRFSLVCLLCVLACQCPAMLVSPIPLEQRKAVMNLPGMCSTEPARRWEGGLVVGNGVMGASVLGQPAKESIVFNQEALFRPILDQRPLPPVISQAVPKVRQLIRNGQTKKAYDYWRGVMAENGHPKIINTPSYHPAYTMKVNRDVQGAVKDYLRTVDFMTGEAVVRFRQPSGQWINRTFVSRQDHVIVQLYETVDGDSFDLALQLVDQWHGLQPDASRIQTRYAGEWMTAQCKYRLTKRGYEGVTRVVTDGARSVNEHGMRIAGATRVLMLTRIVDHEDMEHSDIPGLKAALMELPADYDKLFAAHVPLHRRAMARMSLEVDWSDDRYLSSEELIEKQGASNEIIPAFLQKMIHMGRYALLSSSGRYPPPLTGIWNGSHRPAWSGDWTLDTNINQQIAGANTTGLPEAIRSYLSLIEEIAPSWELNAKNIYGCRGIMSGARTAGRENYHTHFGKWPGHCWTAGAAWLIYPLYEYYQVTGDTAFLKKHVLPLMEKNVLFYEDFLTETDEDGRFLFVPSYSPEHMDGQAMNAVQDIAAGKQAVMNLIDAYTDLGVMPERIAELNEMLEKFPRYLINEAGEFQEWAVDHYQEHHDHRHMSHSYPIWPAHELNWEEHPELMQAMRVAIGNRLPQDWSGHNFAIRAFASARAKYPQMFWANLNRLMRYDFIQQNLVTRHNPGWCPNTDVLCGLPGMMVEALVYSKPGVIELLPAWTPDLARGEAKGILTRTQATVETLQWDLEQKSVTAIIRSGRDQWVELMARQGIRSLNADTEVNDSVNQNLSRRVFLPEGTPVTVKLKLAAAINDYPVAAPAWSQEEFNRRFVEKTAEKKK